jgi:hypothetical protein
MVGFGAPAAGGGGFMILFGGMLNGYMVLPEYQPYGVPLAAFGLFVLFAGTIAWLKGY